MISNFFKAKSEKKKKLKASNESKVRVYVWPSSSENGNVGHVAIKTFTGGEKGKGHYISYWPGSELNNTKTKKVKAHFSKSLKEDLINEATTKDFSLDIFEILSINIKDEIEKRNQGNNKKRFMLAWISDKKEWYFHGLNKPTSRFIYDYVKYENTLNDLYKILKAFNIDNIEEAKEYREYLLKSILISQSCIDTHPERIGYIVDLYSLNPKKINDKYESFLEQSEKYWALPASIRFLSNTNTFNCSSLCWHLLNAGGIKNIFINDFFPIDGFFGNTFGVTANIKSMVINALGSSSINLLLNSFKSNYFFKSAFNIGALVGTLIGGGTTLAVRLIESAIDAIGSDESNNSNAIFSRSGFYQLLKNISFSGIIGGTINETISFTVSNLSYILPPPFTAFLSGTIIGFLAKLSKLGEFNSGYPKGLEINLYSIIIQSSIMVGMGTANITPQKNNTFVSVLKNSILNGCAVFTAAGLTGMVASLAITPNDIARLAIRAKEEETSQYEYETSGNYNTSYSVYSSPKLCTIV